MTCWSTQRSSGGTRGSTATRATIRTCTKVQSMRSFRLSRRLLPRRTSTAREQGAQVRRRREKRIPTSSSGRTDPRSRDRSRGLSAGKEPSNAPQDPGGIQAASSESGSKPKPAASGHQQRDAPKGAKSEQAHEDERFASYNCSSSGGSHVGLPAEPRIDHACLDTEPSQRMKGSNRPQGHLISFHAAKNNTAGSCCLGYSGPKPWRPASWFLFFLPALSIVSPQKYAAGLSRSTAASVRTFGRGVIAAASHARCGLVNLKLFETPHPP